MSADAQLVVDNRAHHGEGPVWDTLRAQLFWVDLTGARLFALEPQSGRVEFCAFSEPICAVAPNENGRLLVAFAKRLAWVHWPSGAIQEIAQVEPAVATNRCNDGKMDPNGRFWIGTMSSDGSTVGAGSLYRLEPTGELVRVLTGLTIANGMGWSPDARTMYFIDSPTRQVWAFDFDQRDSSLARKRTVLEIPPSLGLPDGMTVGVDGNLWIAQWGNGSVGCWDPATGRLIASIETHCPHTTSCAWGGQDGKDLYITTSRLGLNEDACLAAPHSGGLFRYRP